MAISYQYELYVDGVRKFYYTNSFTIEISETYFVDVGGFSTGSYSYEEGAYLGWTTTQGGTTPDYVVGDFISVNGQIYLYSIPAQASSGKTQIGNRAITKKMFGTREITKEVVNGVVVYEKAASAGYSVTITGNHAGGGIVYVQINDDPTWYYAEMDLPAFHLSDTNIPNAYSVIEGFSIGVDNITKIKIGTSSNPSTSSNTEYVSEDSTGDFVGLTFTSTGGSAPAYATGEITMTQNSEIFIEGND